MGARLRTAVFAACLVALLLGAPSVHATVPGSNGKIAYTHVSPSPWPTPYTYEVWSMNADGSGKTQLTQTGGSKPEWSPDGSKIAYENGGYGERRKASPDPGEDPFHGFDASGHQLQSGFFGRL